MTAPELAVGDGALGFWAALREVFPSTREQRCWVHKTANVLAALPDRTQGEAKRALQAIYTAGTRADALDAARALAEQFAEWPKATAKITDDLERLLAFHDFPAEHHVHLRTTNPIESTFATVRLRQRVTKGAGSRSAGLAMAYKLLDAAEERRRRVKRTASGRRCSRGRRLHRRHAPGATGEPRSERREGRRLICPLQLIHSF